MLRVLFDLGEWDRVMDQSDKLLAWAQLHEDNQVEATALSSRAQVFHWRGDKDQAVAIQDLLLDRARSIGDAQVLAPALAVSSLIEARTGATKRAIDLINELIEATRESNLWRAHHIPTVVRILISAGHIDETEELVSDLDVALTRDRNALVSGHAIVAEARHDFDHAVELYEDVARRWSEFGFALEHGQALLGRARCELARGSREEATPPLHQAREIFIGLGAGPLIHQADAHLRKVTALSS